MTLVGGALVIALTVTLVTMSAATMVVEEQVTTQDPIGLHANTKHARAAELRSLWSKGVCEGHELTIFCARRSYWDGIQRSDRYLPIANWPSANRVWRELWH